MESSIESELDAIWADLKTGFEQVYQKENVNKNRFMELYNHVYNYSTAIVCPRISEMTVAQFVGFELYKRIEQYLDDKVKNILTDANELNEEHLLQFYSDQWVDYQAGSNVVNAICAFLNRNWIKKEVDEGNLAIKDVYELALTKWHKIIFEQLKQKVSNAALKLIEKARNGEQVVLLQVQQMVNSFVELGHSNKAKALDLSLYRKAFERQYLTDTKLFYRMQSDALYLAYPKKYLKKADLLLEKDIKLEKSFAHEDTLETLNKIGDTILIRREHIDKLSSSFEE